MLGLVGMLVGGWVGGTEERNEWSVLRTWPIIHSSYWARGRLLQHFLCSGTLYTGAFD